MPQLFNMAARRISGSRLFSAAISGLEAIGDRKRDLLRVLTYHRVAEPNQRRDLDPSIVSATPGQFARQIDWLCTKFNPVSLDSLRAAIAGKRTLPPRSVLVTFDDAYSDFAEHAWPILKSRGVPVVLFVPTAYPDGTERSFWWDRLQCALQAGGNHLETPLGRFDTSTHDSQQSASRMLKRLLKSLPHETFLQVIDDICHRADAAQPGRAVLDWNQLRQLAHDGVTLGAHTHTHPLLNRISAAAATKEIVRSRDVLTEQIGSPPAAFAFPSGHYDEHSVAQVREAGFEFAFTTVRGMNNLNHCDPFMLRRTNVALRKPDALLRAQLHWIARRWNRPLLSSYPAASQQATLESSANTPAEDRRELANSAH